MKRNGKTLVELLVVISILGGVLGTTATIIYQLMRAGQAVESDLRWDRSLTALAEQFRADAHAATAVEVADDGTQLSLTLPVGVVVYSRHAQGIHRQSPGTGGVVQHVTYRCDQSGVRFAAMNELGRTWAVIAVPHQPAALTKSRMPPDRVEILIRAVTGRFSAPQAKAEVT